MEPETWAETREAGQLVPTAGAEPGRARRGTAEGNRAPVGACWLPSSAEQPSQAEPQQGVLPPCAPEQGEEERQWPQDLQPPPPPGPQKEGQKESGGDERPATEPPKVLDTPLSEGDEPITLPAQQDHGHSVQMEGYLGRKHDLEGPNKKASNRWVEKRLRQEGSLGNIVLCWGRGCPLPLVVSVPGRPSDTWHDRKACLQFWSQVQML